jgi:uncharacterized protein (TIGR02271 family)
MLRSEGCHGLSLQRRAREPIGPRLFPASGLPWFGSDDERCARQEAVSAAPSLNDGVRLSLRLERLRPVQDANIGGGAAAFRHAGRIVMQTSVEDIRKEHKLSAESGQGDVVIPIVEEELELGTREIESGGVRISMRVSALPVERNVTLREERVSVERRKVDRPIEERDQAFQERSFELKASAEEPVATKRAHVVEEIRVHKDRSQREQIISETLRHTDIDIADLAANNRELPVELPESER